MLKRQTLILDSWKYRMLKIKNSSYLQSIIKKLFKSNCLEYKFFYRQVFYLKYFFTATDQIHHPHRSIISRSPLLSPSSASKSLDGEETFSQLKKCYINFWYSNSKSACKVSSYSIHCREIRNWNCNNLFVKIVCVGISHWTTAREINIS